MMDEDRMVVLLRTRTDAFSDPTNLSVDGAMRAGARRVMIRRGIAAAATFSMIAALVGLVSVVPRIVAASPAGSGPSVSITPSDGLSTSVSGGGIYDADRLDALRTAATDIAMRNGWGTGDVVLAITRPLGPDSRPIPGAVKADTNFTAANIYLETSRLPAAMIPASPEAACLDPIARGFHCEASELANGALLVVERPTIDGRISRVTAWHPSGYVRVSSELDERYEAWSTDEERIAVASDPSLRW